MFFEGRKIKIVYKVTAAMMLILLIGFTVVCLHEHDLPLMWAGLTFIGVSTAAYVLFSKVNLNDVKLNASSSSDYEGSLHFAKPSDAELMLAGQNGILDVRGTVTPYFQPKTFDGDR